MADLPAAQLEVSERGPGHRYSKTTQATALSLLTSGTSQSQVARQMDIDQSTICRWHQKMKDGWLEQDDELRKLYQAELEGSQSIHRLLWIKAASELIERLGTGSISDKALNAIYGTAFDKDRLASGRSTQNVEKKVRVVNVQGEEL